MWKAHNLSEKAYIEVLHGDKGEPNIVKKNTKDHRQLRNNNCGKVFTHLCLDSIPKRRNETYYNNK